MFFIKKLKSNNFLPSSISACYPIYFAKNRQSTWLELFFDLVFVAVIGVVSHSLSHTDHNHISIQQLFFFFLVFVPLWWVWASYTLYSNRYDQEANWQKILTLILWV